MASGKAKRTAQVAPDKGAATKLCIISHGIQLGDTADNNSEIMIHSLS